MIWSVKVLALVTAERLAELVLARRNTKALRAQGAVEHGASHYPWIVLLHAVWLAGLWLLAWDRSMNATLLAVFGALQMLRIWGLATLGTRWTTRIIVVPGEQLVARGPYRFVAHPNYAVVAAEIAVLPLVFGLFWYAALFTVLNAAILFVRIRTEESALGKV